MPSAVNWTLGGQWYPTGDRVDHLAPACGRERIKRGAQWAEHALEESLWIGQVRMIVGSHLS